MRCHICTEPSIGQCQSCWKFYCQQHGDVFCEKCRSEAKERGLGGGWLGGAGSILQSGISVGVGSLDDASAPDIQMPPEMRAKILDRVVGVGKSSTRGATELSLLSLEIYDDGCILNCRIRSTDDGEWAGLPSSLMSAFPNAPFSATDDSGAKYLGLPAGGSGGPGGDWRGDVYFTPKLTPGAREVAIRIEQIDWSGFGPGQKSRVELGPWEFVVPLT